MYLGMGRKNQFVKKIFRRAYTRAMCNQIFPLSNDRGMRAPSTSKDILYRMIKQSSKNNSYNKYTDIKCKAKPMLYF